MLSNYSQDILTTLRAHQDDMTNMLARMVEYESPSDHKPSLDRFGGYLAGLLQEIGGDIKIFEQKTAGNHICARWGTGERGALILAHMDTVWDLGTILQRPVRVEEGRLYGPGSEDMKGGITIAIWAIKALLELNLLPKKPVSLLLTSDEEIGSETSRPIIESEALKSEVVYVLEPAQPPLGSYKTSRKGVGEYKIAVTGLAAHAGADHAKGVNAIEELAHQIITVQSFTNYEKGTTFNAGVVKGGTRSNVVPAEAQVDIDVRVKFSSEVQTVEEKMKSLKAHLPGSRLEVKGGMNRPPMERTPATVALFNKAKDLAKSIGIELTETGTGGASDGNFTSALGVPTLDGMGVVGDGAHALHEYAEINSLPERAAILALLLDSQ